MYRMKDTDGKDAEIQLLDEVNLKLTLYVDGEELANVIGTYTRDGQYIEIYAYDTYFGCVELFEDGTATWVGSEESVDTEDGLLEGIIPETEVSKWFDEKIAPYIMEAVTAIVGVVVGLVICLKPLKSAVSLIIGAYNALKKSNEDSEQMKKDVEEMKKERLEWEARQEQKMEEYFARQSDIIRENMQGIRKDVSDKLDDVSNVAHKILDVEEIAYANNPIMVSQGTARKIEEVIHNGEKKNESNV